MVLCFRNGGSHLLEQWLCHTGIVKNDSPTAGLLISSFPDRRFQRNGIIIPELENGAWSGQYFVDYPVRVTAKANPGYRFVGWTGDVEGYEESMDVPVREEGVYVMAVFEKE